MLVVYTSKIQFESKSQPSTRALLSGLSWLSIRQRYNLKANHNEMLVKQTPEIVGCLYVKDTI